MPITKVWLDESKTECTKCNLCESLCPSVFSVPDKMIVKENADLTKEHEIKESADSCPVHVIAIELNKSGKRDNVYDD